MHIELCIFLSFGKFSKHDAVVGHGYTAVPNPTHYMSPESTGFTSQGPVQYHFYLETPQGVRGQTGLDQQNTKFDQGVETTRLCDTLATEGCFRTLHMYYRKG